MYQGVIKHLTIISAGPYGDCSGNGEGLVNRSAQTKYVLLPTGQNSRHNDALTEPFWIW